MRGNVRRAGTLLVPLWLVGCGLSGKAIHVGAARDARLALLAQSSPARQQPRLPLEGEDEMIPESGESRQTGSVIIGELLAFFPGMLVQGLGHYYAGDYVTSAQLFRVGEFGLLCTVVGGGVGIGGYYLDKADQQGFAYSMYATGGTFALIGVTYFLTAWFYDMIDTPRAVRSGGEPPPRSPFVEALDFFK
jgi:hypothetical protein